MDKNINLENINLEIWIDLVVHKNYQVSSFGRIRHKKTLKIRKQNIDFYGYPKVSFRYGYETVPFFVHRLIAQAFLPNFRPNLQVNHKNCLKSDNRIENLEMVTPSQNIQHAWDNGRMRMTPRNKKGMFCKI